MKITFNIKNIIFVTRVLKNTIMKIENVLLMNNLLLKKFNTAVIMVKANALIPLPEIILNYEYQTDYNVTMSLPTKSFTNSENYSLFVRCKDKAGLRENQNIEIKIKSESAEIPPPKILKVIMDKPTIGSNPAQISVSTPFESCKYSSTNMPYEQMTDLDCSAEESNIQYHSKYPLGSFICPATITILKEYKNLIIQCKGNSIGSSYTYVLP